jgi:CheY-like chemotaxis protein/HPt (histidine-containing phosphotransfer) domain-containing protein/anti-sigma regulatory factor (Ser/Thr protein kinase)
LLNLIDDILDFSKIEAGKLVLNAIKINLKEMAKEALNIVQPVAEEKGLKLILSQDSESSGFFFLDDIRVKQILINLLSNAIKFTEKGHVKLAVKFKSFSVEEKICVLEFSVTDTGIGISKEKEKVIFEAFAQEDTSTTRKYGGTGLGLTISNKLLLLMDSHLVMESKLGQGSKFSFLLRLPFEDGIDSPNNVKEPIARKPIPKAVPIKKGLNFLLVDDNPVNMLLAKTIVKSIVPSAIILEAKNGETAVALFAKNKPDMVFMDIQMPEMSGFEASKIIRKLETTTKTTIIALTAGTVLGEYERCLEAGMDDYLSKPIVVADIANMIHKYLGTTSPKEEVHFLAKFDEFKNNDPKFFLELVMLSKTSLEKLKDDLLLFNKEKELYQIKRTGHSLKGLALNMDFKNLVKLASDVEQLQALENPESEILLNQIGKEVKQIIKNLDLELIGN